MLKELFFDSLWILAITLVWYIIYIIIKTMLEKEKDE